MRIATGHQIDQALRQIRLAQQRFVHAQEVATTGKRFTRLHEDPAGGALVMNLRAYRGAIGQYQKNLVSARHAMAFTESALSDSNGLMRRAYELAVRGANSSTEQAARNQMASEVAEMQRRLISLANSRGVSGEYIFAGQDNASQPFVLSGSSLAYHGDAGEVRAEIGPNETISVNTQGEALFRDAYAALESLRVNLLGGNVGALSGVDLPALQGRMDAFTQARGAVGARMSHLAEREAQNQRRLDEIAGNISEVQEVDMAEAVFRMKSAEVAYQAALQIGAQGFRLSLLDFIT